MYNGHRFETIKAILPTTEFDRTFAPKNVYSKCFFKSIQTFGPYHDPAFTYLQTKRVVVNYVRGYHSSTFMNPNTI